MEFQRESIFVSVLRTFCKVFFAVIGFFIAVFIISLVYASISTTSLIQERTTITYLPDANGNRDTASATAPVILQINIHGVIGESPNSLGPNMTGTEGIETILLDSRSGALKPDRVKGILLHINTPGGTTLDSDNIYRMLMQYKHRYKVPIFAYVQGLCASGGMYVACSADQIYASPASIIGSVGVVIGPFFNIAETLQKVGAHALTITQGLDKDMMNPTRPWKEGEDASLKEVTAFFYNRFVDLVSTARPRMDRTKLVQEYGANIFDPVKAQQLGYIDVADADRNQALLALLQAAQIDPAKPYQVVQLEEKQQFLASLLSKSPLLHGKMEHSLDLGAPKIRDQVAYLYQP